MSSKLRYWHKIESFFAIDLNFTVIEVGINLPFTSRPWLVLRWVIETSSDVTCSPDADKTSETFVVNWSTVSPLIYHWNTRHSLWYWSALITAFPQLATSLLRWATPLSRLFSVRDMSFWSALISARWPTKILSTLQVWVSKSYCGFIESIGKRALIALVAVVKLLSIWRRRSPDIANCWVEVVGLTGVCEINWTSCGCW